MKFPIPLCFLVVLALVTDAIGFDGSRKGFILGGGLGVAGTTVKQTVTQAGISFEGESSTAASLLTDLKLGVGISPRLLLFGFSHWTWFSDINASGNDVTFANGIGGIGASYYLRPTGPTIYVQGGAGLATWSLPFEHGSQGLNGFGIWLGAGYEFCTHWAIETTFGYGNPAQTVRGAHLDTKASTIGVSLNYMAY